MRGTAGAQAVRNEARIKVCTLWMKIKIIKNQAHIERENQEGIKGAKGIKDQQDPRSKK